MLTMPSINQPTNKWIPKLSLNKWIFERENSNELIMLVFLGKLMNAVNDAVKSLEIVNFEEIGSLHCDSVIGFCLMNYLNEDVFMVQGYISIIIGLQQIRKGLIWKKCVVSFTSV